MLFVWYPNCSTCKKAKAFLDSRFANWAETAPLPCLVFKRPAGQ